MTPSLWKKKKTCVFNIPGSHSAYLRAEEYPCLPQTPMAGLGRSQVRQGAGRVWMDGKKTQDKRGKSLRVHVSVFSLLITFLHWPFWSHTNCSFFREEILAPGFSLLKVLIAPRLPPIQLWFECEVADAKVRASCWCCWEMVTSQWRLSASRQKAGARKT